MLYDKWQSKQLTFDFDCGEIYLVGNAELLKQVWINLLDNAIKFSPVGGTITINLNRTVSSVIIAIANQGNALTEEQATHIFDKFYQVDKSHATSGYGIGLAIVKRIVELHGGTICVETNETSNIIFCTEIPNVNLQF